jgi:RNA-directed DNA polymerase
VAWQRVRANRGSRSAGVDGESAYYVEQVLGVEHFLAGLREELRSGSFRPAAVKQRAIPKRGGKLRYLGIPTVRDRIVQAALKLVLEPIFEVDFEPCSYGFRPGRRAWDAIAEVHYFSSRSYEWIVEADIKACFDELDHAAILGRVRRRVEDKRVLGLIKAFLKAGILTEQGSLEQTLSGTPQGGILSPLMANVALSALDEHYARAWEAMGQKWHQRDAIGRRGGATYRLVRYADDFVICVAGERRHAEALIAQTKAVIAPLGLTLNMEKTRVVHSTRASTFSAGASSAKGGEATGGALSTPTRPSARSRASRRRSGRSRGPLITRRSLCCCTASTRCCGAGAPTFAAGSHRRPSPTSTPSVGGESCAGCDASTPSETGAGSCAVTSRGGGRPTAT